MNQILTVLMRDVIGGFNLLTLIGFLVMGLGLTQSRQGRRRAPIAFALMGLGTAMVFAGIYLAQHRA